MHVRKGAEPFRHAGGEDAVLLIHGFTGSPASMRPWGEHLHAAGYSVWGPLLPGHGTVWSDMTELTWKDWAGAVTSAFDELAAEHERVFVAGLSMGGCLALHLAMERPGALRAMAVVNPAVRRPERLDVPVLLTVDQLGLFGAVAAVMPTVPGIKNDIKKPDQDEVAYDKVPIKGALQLIKMQDTVRGRLSDVKTPIIVFSSPEDHVVEPSNAAQVMSEVGSEHRTQVLLPESYHVATLDNDAPRIFEGSVEFFRRFS